MILRRAVHSGGLRDVRVFAVHVVNSGHLHHWSIHKEKVYSREKLIEQSEIRLGDLVKREASGEEVGWEVCIGKPARELSRIVKERGASMLVISANDTTKLRLGTTASACLRFVPADVLVVRNWQRGDFRKVVVCTDCSAVAGRVIEKAIEMAVVNSAALEILHVIYPPEHDLWGEVLSRSGEGWGEEPVNEEGEEELPGFGEKARSRAQDCVDKTLAPFAKQLEEVSYSTVIVESVVPSVAMACYMEDSGADLVVLGTHCHSKFASVFLGTNAERMLHDTEVSVLAVRY